MKLKDLNKSIAKFETGFDKTRLQHIGQLLAEFQKEFPIGNIPKLRKEDYVYGTMSQGSERTFCYWLEKPLDVHGRISGSPCSQYGVWHGTHGDDKVVKYRNTKKYGNSIVTAFDDIKWNIGEVLKAGAAKDHEKIAQNKIAPKLKGKILATYYPDDYLSIYADEYLDDILKYFNMDDFDSFEEKPIKKQQRLLDFKARHEIMNAWSLTKFAIFLNEELDHNYYPEKSRKKEKNRVPKLIDIALVSAEFADSEVDEDHNLKREEKKPHKKKSPDYLKKSRRAKAIGNRGEQIVFLKEKRDLEKAGRLDLAKKIKWISKETDGQGYDVLSFELDGTPKQIEVKATSRTRGQLSFFLTEFEYQLAKGFKNYYVYIVYETLSTTPSIWRISKPFHPLKKGIKMFDCVHEVCIQPK